MKLFDDLRKEKNAHDKSKQYFPNLESQNTFVINIISIVVVFAVSASEKHTSKVALNTAMMDGAHTAHTHAPTGQSVEEKSNVGCLLIVH